MSGAPGPLEDVFLALTTTEPVRTPEAPGSQNQGNPGTKKVEQSDG
jgi:hypothetical protein